MSIDQRMGSELIDGEYKSHDYTGQYVSMYDDVVRREAAWRSCLMSVCKLLDKTSGSAEYLNMEAKGNDRFTERALNLEQRLDDVDWTHDREAAIKVINEFASESLGDSSPHLAKTLGRLSGEYDKARTKSDSLEESFRRRFEGLSQRVNETMFEEKKNFAKSHVMTNKIPYTSATAVWGSDPTLDLDQIGMPQELADALGVNDNDTILCGRAPQLHSGCIRAFRVSIREGLHGVNSNPEVAPIINGDYDGDSVSLISIHDKDVLEAVKKRAAVALEVIDPRHVDSEGRHKVMVGHGPDLKRTMFHNPEYKEAYETICSRMQDVYDAHCKGVDENGNMRGPDSRYDETYLADMQPWMSRMNRLIKYGQSLGCCKKEGVLDLSNPGSIVESLVDVCIVPGAKGSYNSLSKLCEYAGFRSDGHEGINMEDAWEKLCTSSVMPAIGFSDLRQDGSLVLGVDGDITRNAVMNALDSEPVNWRESREGFETWLSEQVGKTHSDAQEAASVMSDVMAAYDDVVERGVDMVIDYDSIIAEYHTLHSYADDISVQDATALKTVATGEMGMFMQELIMAFPDRPDIACTLAFPLYQKSLDWKHDGEQAVREYAMVPEVRDLLYDGRIGPDGDFGSAKAWSDALMGMYSRLGFDDVNREYVDAAAALLVGEDGKVHGARARAAEVCPPLMATAFQRSGEALVSAAQAGEESLYGAMVDATHDARVLCCATKSVREHIEEGTGHSMTYAEVLAEEVAAHPDTPKSHADSVRREREAMASANVSLGDTFASPNLQTEVGLDDTHVSDSTDVLVPEHLRDDESVSADARHMPGDMSTSGAMYAEAQGRYSAAVGLSVEDLIALMNVGADRAEKQAADVSPRNEGDDYGE
jgi:hypothetical protein